MLLIVTMLTGGTSAWADTSLVYGRALVADEAAGIAAWSDADFGDGNWIKDPANGSYSTSSETGLTIDAASGSRALYNNSIAFTSNAILTFDIVWNIGNPYGSENDRSYLKVGDGITFTACPQSQWGKITIGDAEYPISNACVKNINRDYDNWTIHLVINTATNTVTALTLVGDKGATKASFNLENEVTTGSPLVSPMTIKMGFNRSKGSNITTQLRSIAIYEEAQAVETANYTVKFVDSNGTSLKDNVVRTGAVGSQIFLTDDDVASFTVDGVKYIYSGDNAENYTVSSDGTTVVTVYFHAAQTFHWTLYAVGNANDGSGTTYDLGYLHQGNAIEGDDVTFIYPYYLLYGNTLFSKSSMDGKTYNYSFTPTSDKYVGQLFYNPTDITNVVFFSEAEWIDELSAIQSTYLPMRFSRGLGGYAYEEAKKITTLQPGKYKLTAQILGTAAETTFTFKAGEQTIWSNTTNSQSFYIGNGITGDEFTLEEATDIYLEPTDSWGSSSRVTPLVDWIYIQQTGTVATVTLGAPEIRYNYQSALNACQVHFNAEAYTNGEWVAVDNIYYSIDGGEYQLYEAGGKNEGVMVTIGSTLSYYATAAGYLDSPVTTATVTVPVWQTKEQIAGTNFWREEDAALVLHDDGPTDGYRWIMDDNAGDLLFDGRLATPNENINSDFKIAANLGIVSAQDRTYAVSGLTEGQMLIVMVAKNENNNGGIEEEVPKAPKRQAKGSKAPRRIIAGGQTMMMEAVDGLELDPWNSEDGGWDWADYAFRVTKDGLGIFTVQANRAIQNIMVMGDTPPQQPDFSSPTIDGANRTYTIYKPYNATTLYYTTTLADAAPDKGDAAYSSTTDGSVEVTVTGEGYLYAYAENTSGTSEIAEQYVNGVELTLIAPSINGKSYNSSTGKYSFYVYQYQNGIEGSPTVTIYYTINGGEATTCKNYDYIYPSEGDVVNIWCEAPGYTNSPVITVTPQQLPQMTSAWNSSLTYTYSSSNITLGDEAETGLYQMQYDGNIIASGKLLTLNENMDGGDDVIFRMGYYSGIIFNTPRTYAVQNLTVGQYLYVICYNATITAVENCMLDTWNSSGSTNYLKVTGNGTIRFTITPNQGDNAELSQIILYKEKEDGDVIVEDANGNKLNYHYETATGPATFNGVSSYAEDETKAGRIIIADKVTDKKGNEHEVKYISGYVSNRYNLVSIVFGENIVCVGGPQGNSSSAFYNCTKLEKVVFNAKLDTIGAYSFRYCSALKDINFGDATSLRCIKSYAFQYCIFEDLTINSPLSEVSSSSFSGCDSIKTVTYNGETIPGSFMSGRVYLQTINIGKNVKAIGDYAFQNCYRVKTLNIDAEVSDLEIGQYAFSNVDSLRTVSLPAGITSLGEYCFNSCDSLRTVKFDEASVITAIPNYCFQYCYNLQTVTLPNSVQTIGNHVFYYCSKLREITFGTGLVTKAFPNDQYLFYDCSRVEKMTIPSVNFPFQCSMYSLPTTMRLYVHPDMVATYKASDYTKKYHIIAIGSTEEFDIATDAGGQLATKVPAEVAGNVLRLKITGPINGTDINYLHELMPYLEELDIKDAQIVAGGEDYYRYSVSNGVPSKTSYHWQTEDNVVGQYMFYYMPALKRLLLPAGVTEIKQYGVASNGTGTSYTKLAYVEMPAALTTIGNYAFRNDYYLTKADIPAGVTSIGEYAFNQSGITEAVIPAGVTAIANNTFYYCQKLKTVTLPDGITSIGDNAFSGCTTLGSINMPQSVQTIGSYAFYDCNKLASPLEFPATLKTISSYAFQNCYILPSVTFSEGLETIGYSAFNSCRKLKPGTLPESLTSLGSYAFNDCDSLKTFTFPANIKEVPTCVLSSCNALQSVTLATGTTRINESAFYACPKLTEMNYDQTTLTRIDASAFRNTGFKAITVPENVTYIGSNAFSYCDSLKTVSLPNGVTSMGTYVFDDCNALESANIPTSIATVPSYTFRNCDKLTNVTMHDGITSIGSYAFSGCTALTAIELNNQITSINSSAFYNCQNLVINSLPTSLQTIGSDAFKYTYKLADALTLPESLTTIESSAFYGSGIKQLIMLNPNALQYDSWGYTYYSTYVFAYCDSLVSVTLPKEMTIIPENTFQHTSKLQTIILPDSLKEIGNYAFQESGLETIDLPAKLQTIGYEAFRESKLRAVDLPLKLQTIGDYAFYGTQLTEFRVPKNVTSVGGYVAAYCPNLKAAYLGRKQDYTSNSNFDYFYGCDSLQLLRVYAGTPPGISSYQSSYWDSSTYSYKYRGYTNYRTNCVLEVPDGMVDIYQATDIWKDFKEIRAFESEEWLNQADFAALQKLYNQADGANWTKTWNMESRRHANGKWQGVTTEVDAEDDELFYITAIDLTNNGLNGYLPKELFSLERMTSLNLSHNTLEAKVDTLISNENTLLTNVNMEGNHLRGDLYTLVSKLPNLTDLNVSYNWLTAYSEVTPNTTLVNDHMYRGYQFVDWETRDVVVPEDLMDEVVTNYTPGTPVEITSNTLQTYRHEYGDWGLDISYLYRLYKSGKNLYATSEGALQKNDDLWNADIYYYLFKAPKGQLVAYTSQNPWWSNITHIVRVDWENGDVNGDNTVDVSDLQNVVYYALNDNRPGGYNTFYNYTAADLNGDDNINVQDIVGTVGLVLAYEQPAGSRARYINKVAADGRNTLLLNGNNAMLSNSDVVAGIQLTIAGATTADISVTQEMRSLFNVSMKNVSDGVRIVFYSPQGNTLAPGEHTLIDRIPNGAEVVDARLVDTEAQYLSISTGGQTTAIETVDSSMIGRDTPIYNLAGRRVGEWNTLPAGVYIIQLNGKPYKVKK